MSGRPPGKSGGRPGGRGFSSERSRDGESRSGDSGERKPRFGDEKPAFRRPAGDRPERGSGYGGGEKRRFSSDRRRDDGDSREGGDRRIKFDGDKPPFRRSSGDRPSGGSRFGRGEKRSFSSDRRREGGENREGTERRKKFGGDKENKPAFRSRSTEGPRKRVYKGEKPEYENEKGYNNKARSGKSKPFQSENKFKSDEPDFHSSGEIDQTRNFTENKPAKKDFPEKRAFDRSPKSSDRNDRQWNRKEKHEFYGDKKKSKSSQSFSKGVDDGSTRLNKYIANAGVCSRREADELIAAGVVSVNGEIITEMGYKVMPGDIVKYNNESLKSERLVYILLNKPKDFITTTDDPENRKTVMGLIEKACKERVYPVGRLDRNTTGVLLFTNDGDLAKKLTHPSFEVHKVYQVELDRPVKGTDMEQIREGIRLEDGLIKADEAVYTTPEKNVVGMELHSGKNRIVRRIFEHLGYDVKKLDRVVFAGLTKKDLPRGRWRFLTEMEVASLKMMTGKKAVLR